MDNVQREERWARSEFVSYPEAKRNTRRWRVTYTGCDF